MGTCPIFEKQCKFADHCDHAASCPFSHPGDNIRPIKKYCFSCKFHKDSVPADCPYLHATQTCPHGTNFGEKCPFQAFYNITHHKFVELENATDLKKEALRKYIKNYIEQHSGDDENWKVLYKAFHVTPPVAPLPPKMTRVASAAKLPPKEKPEGKKFAVPPGVQVRVTQDEAFGFTITVAMERIHYPAKRGTSRPPKK